jgi:hypothetical protein
VLSRTWTLWMALPEPERLTHKEATMAKPWLCRIGRHRWQRLRTPKAAGTANAASAESNATFPEVHRPWWGQVRGHEWMGERPP